MCVSCLCRRVADCPTLWLGMERVMTRLENWLDSTRLEPVESCRVSRFCMTRKLTRLFSSLFCHWIKWNSVGMFIYEALVTEKNKIRLLSPVLAVILKSRVRSPARLEWVTRITKILTRSTPTYGYFDTEEHAWCWLDVWKIMFFVL